MQQREFAIPFHLLWFEGLCLPQNSSVEILTPKVTALEGGPLGGDSVMREELMLFVSTQSTVACYRSPNRLRHNILIIPLLLNGFKLF